MEKITMLFSLSSLKRCSLVLGCLLAVSGLAAMAEVQEPEKKTAKEASSEYTPAAPRVVKDSPSEMIQKVVNAKYMTGYPDGNFYPERGVSRAELASILVKVFQLDKRRVGSPKPIRLLDVPDTYWAYPAIQNVLRTDIMEGYHRDNRFFPNQKVTRAEGFAIFAQAYGVFQFEDDTLEKIVAPYADIDKVPAWAQKAMATALHEGFVNTQPLSPTAEAGAESGHLVIHPLAPMTRGDLAYALAQYIDRQHQGSPFKMK
jgi:hypothetical protein